MKQKLKIKLMTCATMTVLAITCLTVGCARTLSKTEETHVSRNGTVSTKEQTVTQNPDGTISRSETHKVNRP
jgi:hypothetical protein